MALPTLRRIIEHVTESNVIDREFTIVWQALWGGASKGNVRDVVLNCIIAQMKNSSSQFRDRFISLRAYRA